MIKIRGAILLSRLTLASLALLGHYHLDFSGATLHEVTFNLLSGLGRNPEFSWDAVRIFVKHWREI